MHYLDIEHPSVVERVEFSTSEVSHARFVKVDIVALTNPKLIALSFDVSFKPEDGAAVPLGTFGPFPADNLGQFIVPTKGVVRSGGTIIVSMKIPDDARAEGGSIRVAMGRISLTP